MGYGNMSHSETIYPTLSTIHQPTHEMGHTAADALIDSLEKKIRPGRNISLEPELIIRESTRLFGKS